MGAERHPHGRLRTFKRRPHPNRPARRMGGRRGLSPRRASDRREHRRLVRFGLRLASPEPDSHEEQERVMTQLRMPGTTIAKTGFGAVFALIGSLSLAQAAL